MKFQTRIPNETIKQLAVRNEISVRKAYSLNTPDYMNTKMTEILTMTLIWACSSLSTSFLKSILGSQFDDGCDALFFNAIFRSCGVRVIFKISVIFVFL